MRFLAIVNPVSGRRNLAGDLAEVVEQVREAGGTFVVRVTRSPGDGAHLAAEAAPDTTAILVVGGDGTVREVIEGLLADGKHTPLVIMRNGTENLVAKELNQPTTPQGVVRTLLAGDTIPCDVGQVNGRRFLLVAGAGFDAEVVHRVAAARRGHITHWDYFWPICRTLGTHRFPRLWVVADGAPVFDGRGLAFVGIMPRYSLGLRVLKRARHDDGLLDLCILPCTSRPELVGHALNTLRRNHDRTDGVVYRKCQQIQVAGEADTPLEIDGDPGGLLPAMFSILPSAATFLSPRAASTRR